MLALPGAVTATEVQQASTAGLNGGKSFPAEVSGGAVSVKALAQMFNGVQFIPTGGISSVNVAHYLAMDAVVAVGESWMALRELSAARDMDRIVTLISEAVALVGDTGETD